MKVGSAFLITPCTADAGSRAGFVDAGALADIDELDHVVRTAFSAADVEYLSGISAWAVRFPDHRSLQHMRELLHGVPLEVHGNDWVYSSD